MMKNILKKRWLKLWEKIGAKGDAVIVFDDLAKRYSEPHRFYHTLNHINRCLDEFELVRHLAVDPEVIEMAIWHHDIVYNTRAKDNEDKSAQIFLAISRKARLAEPFIKKVVGLILATKHEAIPNAPDAKIIVDLDIANFGQSKEIFEEYRRQIRKEYEWVPNKVFTVKSIDIFKLFLDRKHIYQTGFFRKKYEAQARKNLKRALAQLSEN